MTKRRGVGFARALGSTLCLVGLLGLGGCIAVVIPTFSKRDPGVDAARWLAERGRGATRAEVLLHFGSPDFASDAESLWLYRWHDARARGFFCVAAYGSAGKCVLLDYYREFDLVLRFGSDGAVQTIALATGLERGTETGTTCAPDGLCVVGVGERLGGGPEWAVPMLDLEWSPPRGHLLFERDALPESMAAPASGCRLAVLPAAGIASIFVDGAFAGVAAPDGWIRLDVDAGEHVVAVRDARQPPSASRVESAGLACRDGDRVFLEQARAGPFGQAGGRIEVVRAIEVEAGRRRTRRYLAP